MQIRRYQTESFTEGMGALQREWSRHRLQVQRGSRWRLNFAIRSITPAVSLSRLAYGAAVVVQPQDRANVLLLKMPLTGRGLAVSPEAATPVDATSYGLIDVRSVERMHCGEDLDMLVLRIAFPRLEGALEALLGRRPGRPLRFAPAFVQGTAEWSAWAPVASALRTLHQEPAGELPQPALDALDSWVVSTLLLTQQHSFSEELLAPGRRDIAPRHVRRAEEYIAAHLQRPLSAEVIAHHAGVSVRALFDGFRTFRGTTPAAYVRDARLRAAREELLCGDSCVGVVAQRWGYRHAGHFAAQYRSRFGEAPGETLRLRARTH